MASSKLERISSFSFCSCLQHCVDKTEGRRRGIIRCDTTTDEVLIYSAVNILDPITNNQAAALKSIFTSGIIVYIECVCGAVLIGFWLDWSWIGLFTVGIMFEGFDKSWLNRRECAWSGMPPGAVLVTLENYKLTVRFTSGTQTCPPWAKLKIWLNSCSVCVCGFWRWSIHWWHSSVLCVKG